MNPLEVFAQPLWLLGLGVLPLLAVLQRRAERRRARVLETWLGPRAALLGAERDAGRARRARALGLAALACAALALAQPRLGRGADATADEPFDVIVCLDVSRSMLARDVPPSRLGHARAELAALAERARGERLALILFAGEARLRVPLTRDLDALLLLAQDAGPLSVELGGSQPASALDLAREVLAARAPLPGRGAPSPAVVVLIADGDHGGERAASRARELAQLGYPVSCLGIGTREGGKIPLDAQGREGFFTDRAGNELIVRLERAELEPIARAGGGRYVEARPDADTLAELYATQLLPAARRAAARERERPARFQWPLLGALALGMLVLRTEVRRAT